MLRYFEVSAVCEAVRKGPPETWGPPQAPDLHPSQQPSAVCTVRAWSACRPTPVPARPPIIPVWVASHRIIAATWDLHGLLLYQVARPTWAKPSRRPKKPPQSSASKSPCSSFTPTYWRSHPESSLEETSGMPYRRVQTLPTRPHPSPRPSPLTPPHRRPSVVSK